MLVLVPHPMVLLQLRPLLLTCLRQQQSERQRRRLATTLLATTLLATTQVEPLQRCQEQLLRSSGASPVRLWMQLVPPSP